MKTKLDISSFHTIYINDEAFYPDDWNKLFDENNEAKEVIDFYSVDGKQFIQLEGEDTVECFGVAPVSNGLGSSK